MAERLFGGLGRWIVRHPWYPIIFWIALLLVAAPFLAEVGSVTNNSATSLPPSAPSSIASAKIAELFPNQSAASESLVVLVGPGLLDPSGQGAVLNLTRAIQSNGSLRYLSGVDSLYTGYESYLVGQAEMAVAGLDQGMTSSPSALEAVNESAQVAWAPVALYVQNWEAFGAANPTLSPALWDLPAYMTTLVELAGQPAAQAVLSAFYNGASSSGTGFAGGADCAADPATVVVCADGAVRVNVGAIVPSLTTSATGQQALRVALATLGVENYSSASSLHNSTADFVGVELGLPGSFLETVWSQFPDLTASPLAIATWAAHVTALPMADYPLPVPGEIARQFLAADGQAELIIITFAVGDDYTDAQGNNPVFADVDVIGQIGPGSLAASDPGHPLAFYQTGEAPLDSTENSVLNSSIAVVLPLTVIVLLAITMLYFRTPLAPILTFGGLGIALGLGVGAVVLIGKFVTHVDVTSIELEETFVLGIGTDYSIFLVSRFREELNRGVAPNEAVVTSVTWAGQSVATSGATAIIATLALAFSGVTLLSQWGIVLSVAILATVLISLTIIPATLVLLGRRVFWPYVGARFDAQAARVRAAQSSERTYFFRAGRFAQRRPKMILALLILVSLPILYVALNVPLGYDFYAQLPAGHPATEGLSQLGDHFGQGYAFPIQSLITFRSPLLVGNTTNRTEFTDLATITNLFANTSGVGAVSSPVGAGGPGLSAWLNFSTLPLAPQENLRGTLGNFVGSDGSSVLLTIVPTTSGLGYPAVSLLGTLQNTFQAYTADHPGPTAVYFAGGAPITHDLQQQTSQATERMVLAVCIGLIVVLFVVLRSWIIPLLAVVTIGLSISWAWGITYLVFQYVLGLQLFFFVPTILFIVILGLGIDYNIFLLTRVREERLKGNSGSEAAVRSVAMTGGIITAAAVILGTAFAVLTVGEFVLLRAIGFSVAVAVLLDAMVVRTYFVPSALHALGERVWSIAPFRRPPAVPTAESDGIDDPNR
jgi:RND superfamily putative drug exporter